MRHPCDTAASLVRALAVLAMILWPPACAAAASDLLGATMPYDAFDRMPDKSRLQVPGGTINVGIAPGKTALPQHHILDWVEKSAGVLVVYYGRFPVTAARVLIVPAPGAGVLRGQAWGYRGAAIRVTLGTESRQEHLIQDWKLVHEMIHLALPRLHERHSWLSEGLAVYVESIARVQAGHLTAQTIWSDFLRDMPRGLPEAGDGGLDNTPTWARTYWGGALFCLLADIEIRKRTGNRRGLQHALRAIVEAGGTHETSWDIRKVFAIADTATGVRVLAELYEQMRARPVSPDLTALWRRLGVARHGSSIVFDDSAELGEIRRAITAPPGAPLPNSG